jgi:hypothetical protein
MPRFATAANLTVIALSFDPMALQSLPHVTAQPPERIYISCDHDQEATWDEVDKIDAPTYEQLTELMHQFRSQQETA